MSSDGSSAASDKVAFPQSILVWLPVEILVQITDLLDWKPSLRNLCVSGNLHLWHKLSHLCGITSISVHSPLLNPARGFALPFPLPGLHSLTIHVNSITFNEKDACWASQLPRTLRKIDFMFRTSNEVWLAPLPRHSNVDSYFTETTDNFDPKIRNMHLIESNGASVMSMKDYFPNLISLELNHANSPPYDGWSVSMSYYFLLNLPDHLTRLSTRHISSLAKRAVALPPLPKSLTDLASCRAASDPDYHHQAACAHLIGSAPHELRNPEVYMYDVRAKSIPIWDTSSASLEALSAIELPSVLLHIILKSLPAPSSLTSIVALQPRSELMSTLTLPPQLRRLMLLPEQAQLFQPPFELVYPSTLEALQITFYNPFSVHDSIHLDNAGIDQLKTAARKRKLPLTVCSNAMPFLFAIYSLFSIF